MITLNRNTLGIAYESIAIVLLLMLQVFLLAFGESMYVQWLRPFLKDPVQTQVMYVLAILLFILLAAICITLFITGIKAWNTRRFIVPGKTDETGLEARLRGGIMILLGLNCMTGFVITWWPSYVYLFSQGKALVD